MSLFSVIIKLFLSLAQVIFPKFLLKSAFIQGDLCFAG